MNRITKISASLAIGLFIASALAISPGAAAAQTLDIRIQSDTGGLPPGGTDAHRPFRRPDGSRGHRHPPAQSDERPL
jgi:hypothetical protein